MKRILTLALAAAFLLAPGIVRAEEDLSKLFEIDQPLVLPDSDTSSLGVETLPEETPFMLRCTNAKEFTATLKRLEAKGMIVGEDMLDKTLVMVFKFKDGSLTFARSDKQGKTLCIFGAVGEPDINLGVVMDGPDRQVQN